MFQIKHERQMVNKKMYGQLTHRLVDHDFIIVKSTEKIPDKHGLVYQIHHYNENNIKCQTDYFYPIKHEDQLVPFFVIFYSQSQREPGNTGFSNFINSLDRVIRTMVINLIKNGKKEIKI